MSELIEVHQLDYKACSLTYGEGACTAEAGTRPAGYGVASFNGTTSKIDITPFLDSETTPKEFTFKMIFTGSSDFDYKIYREYPSGLELSVERVSGNYFGRLNVGGATATNQITGVQLNTEHEVSLKIYRSGTKTRIEARLDGSGGGLGEANGYINAANITTAEIGKASSNGNSFEIRDFKAYKNGVLVRDLPLNGDVTDATGNTTPTATDVTFETVCPDITRDVAEFNGSNSYVSLPAFVENDASEYKIEFDTVLDFTGGHTFYIEQAGTSTDFILFSLNYSNNLVYASCQIGTGASNQHLYSGFNSGDFLKVSFMVTESQVNALNTYLYIDINGNAAGPLYISSRSSSATKTDGKIGVNTNKIWNFKRYINDVLQNDLPLESDVTDATGNSTPIATDVSFVSQALSGVDPDNPTLCALQPDPDKKCFNTYATCQDTPNYSATTKTLTFTKQNSALPKESGSTVGFFPSITNSSHKAQN